MRQVLGAVIHEHKYSVGNDNGAKNGLAAAFFVEASRLLRGQFQPVSGSVTLQFLARVQILTLPKVLPVSERRIFPR